MIDPGPSVEPLKFSLGETWQIIITCTDGNGDLVDLTGLLFAGWRVANDDGIWIDAQLGSGISVDSDPTTGVLSIAITDAMQLALEAGTYQHELRITTAEGITSTQMIGTLTLIDSLFAMEITRACIASASGAASASAFGVAA